MKKSILFASALAALLTVTINRATAHPGGHETAPQKPPAPAQPEHGHEHTTKIPESIADRMKEIEKQQVRLTKAVADEYLEDAHDYAFAIRDLAKSLVDKVPDAKKTDIEQAATKIATIAADIDRSSAAGAQKTTESNVRAMGNAIKTLQTIVARDH